MNHKLTNFSSRCLGNFAGFALIFSTLVVCLVSFCHTELFASPGPAGLECFATRSGTPYLEHYEIGSIPSEFRRYAAAETDEIVNLTEAGKFSTAETRCLKLVAMETAKLGPDQPFLITALFPLSWIYDHQRRYSEECMILERIERLQISLAGVESPDAAATFCQRFGWIQPKSKGIQLAHERLAGLENCGLIGFYARAKIEFQLAKELAPSSEAHQLLRRAVSDILQVHFENRDRFIELLDDIGNFALCIQEKDLAMQLFQRVMIVRGKKSSDHDRDVEKSLGALRQLAGESAKPEEVATIAGWQMLIRRTDH